MNKKERLATAITLSLFAHFLLFQTSWNFQDNPMMAKMNPLVLEFEQKQKLSKGEGLSLHQEKDDKDSDLQDKKRLSRQTYLEDIQQEIHKNRLKLDSQNLIGIVWYSFQINRDGAFSAIALEKTSSNPTLDRDAHHAINISSKKIKRPLILGTDDFSIMIPIKYQYSLY